MFGNNNDQEGRERTSAMLRIIMGGYLLYLSFQLFKGIRSGEADGNKALLIGAMVLFIAVGGFVLIQAVRTLIKIANVPAADDSADGGEAAADGAPVQDTVIPENADAAENEPENPGDEVTGPENPEDGENGPSGAEESESEQ